VERYRGLLGRLLLDGVTGLRDMASDVQVLAYLSLEVRLDTPGCGRRARPYRQKLPI
jgi:hypothetical protein